MTRSLEESNAAFVRQLYSELFHDWNLESIDKSFAPEFRSSEMPPGAPSGPTGVRQFYGVIRAAFPDLTYTVEDLIAQGDKVVVRWCWNATHQGTFRGIPPTGKKITLTGIAIYKIAAGKAVQRWVEGDVLTLLRALGAEIVVPSEQTMGLSGG